MDTACPSDHVVVTLLAVGRDGYPDGALEASPSPVYGAALLMRFGLNAHRGFKSLRLRHRIVASDLRQRRSEVSATLENEADATLENEATGSCCLVCRVLGSHAGQGVDSAVA